MKTANITALLERPTADIELATPVKEGLRDTRLVVVEPGKGEKVYLANLIHTAVKWQQALEIRDARTRAAIRNGAVARFGQD